MFNTDFYQQAFFSFLENEYAFLFVSEASDLKRTSFLNEVIEVMDEQKTPVYFRLNTEIDLAYLIDQMTERFFIPVRSVNVSLLRQFQDQLDILRQMKQRVVLLVEDAHQLSHKNLLILLELASYQKRFAAMSIVLLGKPSLEKRLIQSGKFSEDLALEILPLCASEPIAEEKAKPRSFYIAWLIEKRIRLISIFALILFSFFLWWFEGGGKKSSLMPSITPTTQETKLPLHEIPQLKAKPASGSEFKDVLFYLKSLEQQVGHHWGIKLTEDHLPLNQEKLPMLPLPQPIKGSLP